jgi:hypothetical protein
MARTQDNKEVSHFLSIAHFQPVAEIGGDYYDYDLPPHARWPDRRKKLSKK